MLQPYSPVSSLTMIEQPRCPRCQICMMLAGVESSFPGPVLRTFECPKCELAYKALAGPNEIENKAGWLKSELSATSE
jgi:hypothetical protein